MKTSDDSSGAPRTCIRIAGAAPRAVTMAVGLLCLLILVSIAGAHAVVHPPVAAPGAYQKYVLRVPNERAVPTTRVTLDFPPDVRVVSFADVPGWDLEVERDGAGRVVGAVWTGRLGVERFVEFPFVAVNPATEATLRWNATQTYASGERVEWTGPEGSDTPASFTRIERIERAASPGPAAWIAGAALLLSLVSLGLVLRRPPDAEDAA